MAKGTKAIVVLLALEPKRDFKNSLSSSTGFVCLYMEINVKKEMKYGYIKYHLHVFILDLMENPLPIVYICPEPFSTHTDQNIELMMKEQEKV